MKHALAVLLAGLALASPLYAANPCTTGGAPVQRDGSGQGGTGVRPADGDGSGQGGTGLIHDGDGSGSGGTGIHVEVEGVITGFASICVNGLELRYAATTPVSLHGRSASTQDLAVGQVVRAQARGQGDQLAVQTIQVRHLLVAPLQSLQSGQLAAQGRTISLNPGMAFPSGLVPGVRVAVSGFVTAPGRALATRLDIVAADTPDSLSGEVRRNARGGFSVDGVTLDGRIPRLEPGEFVRAEGRYAEGRMAVSRIEREARDRPAERVVVQGPVRRLSKDALDIGGQRFQLDALTQVKPALPRSGEWARIDAVRKGETLHARDVERQPGPGIRSDKPFPGEKDVVPLDAGASRAPRQEPAGDPASRGMDTHREDAQAERPEPGEAVERAEKSGSREEKVDRPEPVERPEKPRNRNRSRKSSARKRLKNLNVQKKSSVQRKWSASRNRASGENRENRKSRAAEKIEKAERPEKIERVRKSIARRNRENRKSRAAGKNRKS